MEFTIEHTWDSLPVSHEPVTVRMKSGSEGLLMEVSAPFFNDPPAPLGEPGKPFNGLWDYEVVEAFFLSETTKRYLEVELCPHGQHLLLLLSGRRRVWKQELALTFEVSRTETKWEGRAHLPWSYFPPCTDKFNAFAIHGSEAKRTYEALYPVPQHEIQKGQKPDLNVFTNNHQTKSLEGKMCELEYKITNTWDSIKVMHEPVIIRFKAGDQGLIMEVNSLFFDDPSAPSGEPGKPFDGLWDYEVVESFFLNSETKDYLEVELCPHGQHLVLLLSGGNCFEKGLDLIFKADINWNKWNGTALIPWRYFPPGVDKMNSYAIHGSGIGRTYEALYPIPREDIESGQGPNFHRLEYFKRFSLKWIMGENWEQPASDLWK
ncbi:UPF0462 protein C4orf33 homolog [Macrochelys suwanniensis]